MIIRSSPDIISHKITKFNHHIPIRLDQNEINMDKWYLLGYIYNICSWPRSHPQPMPRPPRELRSAAVLRCHRAAERLETLQLCGVAKA